MSIQRYGDPSRDYMIPADAEGFLVLYADHVAAVNDALTEALDAVAAVGQQHPKWDLMSTHYEGCWKHHSECALTLALAAIDALRETT